MVRTLQSLLAPRLVVATVRSAIVVALVMALVGTAAGPPAVAAPPSSAGGPSPAGYIPPVAGATVVDHFRAPASPYAAGNRGLDEVTVPGSVVVASGAGRVIF